MTGERTFVDYVSGSSVRADLVGALHDDPRSTAELLEGLEASESAVYDAIGDLESRGLIVETEGRRATTGRGTTVAERLADRTRLDALLADDYWVEHDVEPLPGPFRRRMHALAGASIVRAAETDPNRVVRIVRKRIERADSIRVVSPIYHEEFAEGLERTSDSRLVLDRAVVRDLSAEIDRKSPDPGTVRISDVGFALVVTDRTVMLSLPTMDGRYDPRSEVIAETENAVEWGNRLFEFCWSTAVPPAESSVTPSEAT